MEARFQYQSCIYAADLTNPLDISIEISPKKGASAWYVDLPKITPVKTEHFNGSVVEGGDVNFRNIFFNPHGNGTHTESVGHIAEEVYSVNKSFKKYFFSALLITVQPVQKKNGEETDLIITQDAIASAIGDHRPEAIVIRTLPNDEQKLTKNYSQSNPPYFEEKAIEYINELNISHLLVDLPSLDREQDDGKLAGHHIFWNYPKEVILHKTITEFIFVKNNISDGLYLLNLQVAPFENDASPSRPILYPLKVV